MSSRFRRGVSTLERLGNAREQLLAGFRADRTIDDPTSAEVRDRLIGARHRLAHARGLTHLPFCESVTGERAIAEVDALLTKMSEKADTGPSRNDAMAGAGYDLLRSTRSNLFAAMELLGTKQ